MTEKFDFEDITIVPAELSDVDSRSQINLEYLPLIVAPMDSVVDVENYTKFTELGYEVCMPRGTHVLDADVFISFGLDEIIDMLDNNKVLPGKLLIDIANGHMRKLYDTAKRIKEDRPEVVLMVGNIANPETFRKYCEIGVDYVRVGIGGGSACTTSANSGVHYPMGSLIKECAEISWAFSKPAKIVADGGFRKFPDIIKALALGADYVMIGGILNKCIEACSPNYKAVMKDTYDRLPDTVEKNTLLDLMAEHRLYKRYRGMSTKEVQKDWGKTELKTAEGIAFYNKVEYTLNGWTSNFVSYLKTAMSYSSAFCLTEFKGEALYVCITENARKRFTK
jgi:putative N-acetylmannosamine-6-phosphate epimerase